MSEKLCRDCVHSKPDRSLYLLLAIPIFWFLAPLVFAMGRKFADCRRGVEETNDLDYSVVSGEKRRVKHRSCVCFRIDYGHLTTCGRAAKFFEPKRRLGDRLKAALVRLRRAGT